MSEFKIVVNYPYPQAKVWRALTDPVLISVWTLPGKGARPVGFDTKIGTKFQYVANPMPGWNGIVECEIVECVENSTLSYKWISGGSDKPSLVTYHLEPHSEGTRFTWEHTGFKGIGGAALSKMMRGVREKMLTVGVPPILRDLDEDGNPVAGSELAARLAEMGTQ